MTQEKPLYLYKIRYIQRFFYILHYQPATGRLKERVCLSIQKVNKAYTKVKKLKLTAIIGWFKY